MSAAEQPSAPAVTVGPVTATSPNGQAVTAGAIGTVNQIMPTLVRGPLLDKFKQVYTTGARMRSDLLSGDLSDQQYQSLVQQVNDWLNSTYFWLKSDVSEYAAERFNFRPMTAMHVSLAGNHDPDIARSRGNAIVAMDALLQNLDVLMREPTIYPDK
ncbi:hypothetical protein [Phenylobacterium sp.]|uniref:hypothetical protein n=1 Tax=Phenylobacterium sp. TaxID=1871053 RepID=UPI0012154B41|nr:hypothetical protein [Phenylobacterium sp.]THD58792.1 MAG: hypothetical protein E8A49_17510 [Phenylobacterium sp.]